MRAVWAGDLIGQTESRAGHNVLVILVNPRRLVKYMGGRQWSHKIGRINGHRNLCKALREWLHFIFTFCLLHRKLCFTRLPVSSLYYINRRIEATEWSATNGIPKVWSSSRPGLTARLFPEQRTQWEWH